MVTKTLTATREVSFKQKEEDALDFVREVIQKHDLPYYVAFSGGKDSLVVGHIVKRVDTNVEMVFSDTTIEFPALIDYIRVLNQKGWNIKTIKPTVSFEEGLKKFGPPGRRRRWCCDVIKKASAWKNNREISSQKGALTFLGIRSRESYRRARYKRLGVFSVHGPAGSKKFRVVQAYPLFYFTTDDVWNYIKKHHLPYCKLYDYGATRLGCMFCPYSDSSSDRILVKFYPELKKKWIDYLKKYAKDNGLHESWSDGAWRNSYGVTKDAVVGSKEVLDTRIIRYRFQEPLSPRQKTFFAPFRKYANVKIKFFPGNKTMLVSQPRWEAVQVLQRVEIQILKALNCINCSWCLILCSHIEMKDNRIHIKDSCTGCLKCTYKVGCTVLRWGGNINTLKNLGTAQWGRKKIEIY